MFPEITFMRLAHRLARKGIGRTSPNPAVGAVLVKDGVVVGTGWHRAAGMPHAEIEAIASAGERARGADLYVNLEPCSHRGRTGPCAEAVLAAGVRRVAASMEDPNPLVSGGGFRKLKAGGVEVHAGMMEAEARDLNRFWIHWILTGRPFVTLKLATSLDGQIAGSSGESRWVTEERARSLVHRMRSGCDGVLVGGRTAIADDPLLTCRIRGGKNPERFVLTSRPEKLGVLRMFSDRSARNTVFVPEGTRLPGSGDFPPGGAEVVRLAADNGEVEAHVLLEELARRGITSLLVEGGGRIAGTFLRAGAVDRLVLFLAPVMFGEAVRSVTGWAADCPSAGRRFSMSRIRRVGEDLMIEALPVKSDSGKGDR